MSVNHRWISTATRAAVRAGLALPTGPTVRWRAGGPGGRGRTGGRVLARVVLGLPLDALALLLAGYALFNSVRNFGYPVWYLGTDYHQAWGGPSMAGVWAVHAAGWGLCLYLLLRWPMRWIARGRRALTVRLLGGPSAPAAASAPAARAVRAPAV